MEISKKSYVGRGNRNVRGSELEAHGMPWHATKSVRLYWINYGQEMGLEGGVNAGHVGPCGSP